jgi:hypothetical protein
VSNAQRASEPRVSTEQKVERLLQEINMLNLERFLFSTDRQKATGAHTERTFTDSKGKKYTFAFGKFGQPGEVAYRVFHAGTHHFVENARVCDGDACHFRLLAAISKRRLAALCGRSWSGGKDDSDYHDAIMSLATTMVTVEWYDKKTDTTQWQTFNPFSSAFFAAKGNQTRTPAGARAFAASTVSIRTSLKTTARDTSARSTSSG